MSTVLAVDPGRMKCGVAIVRREKETASFEAIYRAVVPTTEIAGVLSELIDMHLIDVLIVGNGTTNAHVIDTIKHLRDARIEVVDEKFSTQMARKRFFRENPPRGLRKLIPTSLQIPGRPYDDYVAVILAENYLSSHN